MPMKIKQEKYGKKNTLKSLETILQVKYGRYVPKFLTNTYRAKVNILR